MNDKDTQAMEAYETALAAFLNDVREDFRIIARVGFGKGYQAALEHVRAGQPIDVILFCPNCKGQHIDRAEPNICQACGRLSAPTGKNYGGTGQ